MWFMVNGARYSVPRNILIIYILGIGNIIILPLPKKNIDITQSLMHYAYTLIS